MSGVLKFAAGVMVAGFGVALSTQAGLGATPISSVPWVLTFVTPLSYGTLTLIINIFFVLAQVAILRRRFPIFQFLQIPATALFGLCIDLGMWLSRPFVTEVYVFQVAMLVVGAAVLAVGILLQVRSDFLCIPGDALVKVASREFGLPLSRLKITLDGSLTLVALVTSALSLGRIEGVREGTILSVFLVGTFIGLFSKVFPK
ncbi:MAG: DUF6198 family protein [bacterium]|nr:DUF6198 family protein [bacterium]